VTYAAILVHVQATPEGERRLGCAVALSRVFDATLIGLGAETFPAPVAGYGAFGMSADWYGPLRKAAEDSLDLACAAFNTATDGQPKPAVWQSYLRLPLDAMAEAARGADLIVASAPTGRNDDVNAPIAAGDLVIRTGRPVLVAPSGGQALSGDKVVLAWRDTREARRALADALPFFRRAKAVLVLEICGPDGLEDAEARTTDVVAALARHGVAATAKVVQGHADADVLAAQADAFGADLIVAGGYGHSRLGEMAFGGMTRDLLAADKHYVLLSH